MISYADGFVLVYSITDRSSFVYLQELLQKIHRVNLHRVNIVVVGTKADKQKHREVAREEGEEYALQNNCLFFETSAYIPKQDVKEIFCCVTKRAHSGGKRHNSDVGMVNQKYRFMTTLRSLMSRRRVSTGTVR